MSVPALLLQVVLCFMASTLVNSDSVCSGVYDSVSGVDGCSGAIIYDAGTYNYFSCSINPFTVPASSGICYYDEFIYGRVLSDFVMDENSFINMQRSSSMELYVPLKLATNCQINIDQGGAIWIAQGSINMYPGARWHVGSFATLGRYGNGEFIVLTIGANAKFVMGTSSTVATGDYTKGTAALTLGDGTSLIVGTSSLLHIGANATLMTVSMDKVAEMVIENRVNLTISDGTKCLVIGHVNVFNLTEPVVWFPGFKGDNIMCTSGAVAIEIMALMHLNTTEADKGY